MGSIVWVKALTERGWVTFICVSILTITGSDNGLSPGRRQAIIWTNAGILLIGPSGTNFSENLIEILTFSLRKCDWKCRSFCLGLNVLTDRYIQRQMDKTMAMTSIEITGWIKLLNLQWCHEACTKNYTHDLQILVVLEQVIFTHLP